MFGWKNDVVLPLRMPPHTRVFWHQSSSGMYMGGRSLESNVPPTSPLLRYPRNPMNGSFVESLPYMYRFRAALFSQRASPGSFCGTALRLGKNFIVRGWR